METTADWRGLAKGLLPSIFEGSAFQNEDCSGTLRNR